MRLLAAGTRMPDGVDAGFDDYASRLRGDYRLELVEIPLGERGGGGDVRRAVEAEGRRMLAAAGERSHLVALQVGGRSLPTEQLARWLKEAQAAGMVEPTAMTLATATADGQPSARIVLYKGPHQGGLTFYTNYQSRKGGELAPNPRAALVFWWDKLERSVRVEGRVEKLPRAMSEAYARSRPR